MSVARGLEIKPGDVHDVLRKKMLADGMSLIFDVEKSHGNWVHDALTGEEYLDFFALFASSPIGYNHPKLTTAEFMKKLGRVAVNKPTNSDVYSVEMAQFVDTFSRVAVPDEFAHLFFIAGGALAVENALKAAFDWKVRKNLAAGKGEKGYQVIHFRQAFHGRSGYTLSVTNTADLAKTRYFPMFSWPRITNPAITFPLDEKNLAVVQAIEAEAIAEIHKAIVDNPDDIAAIIIEPVQGEGGDNHFREEFLVELRKIADENEILLIFDEIQTGLGATGKMWCWQHFDVAPDILVFGKKTQVCGIMVTSRIDEVPDNVFKVSSRINSTWGGNLTDMVRCQRYLEVIEEENLVENAARSGEHLLAGLAKLAGEFPEIVTNIRGRGCFAAFSLPNPEIRDRMVDLAYERKLLVFKGGVRSIRFRPALTISVDEIDRCIGILGDCLKAI
ncbi:MAG: L-lysine 6-transaminase [Candidatus Eisenbacteria sp.]|nr:L-lysine 6-transaminase [Candidatus Eisenbacteria bacterium]